ncbi:hypothetical protein VNO77_20181 [Canavalia gladiata]|uniref:Uncharacterized protein n=1 Tax=Canavalia gladiata TaxID=3824 RepID=A0AAN9LNU6_CANGL
MLVSLHRIWQGKPSICGIQRTMSNAECQDKGTERSSLSIARECSSKPGVRTKFQEDHARVMLDLVYGFGVSSTTRTEKAPTQCHLQCPKLWKTDFGPVVSSKLGVDAIFSIHALSRLPQHEVTNP